MYKQGDQNRISVHPKQQIEACSYKFREAIPWRHGEQCHATH
jgi:hypothetical protein